MKFLQRKTKLWQFRSCKGTLYFNKIYNIPYFLNGVLLSFTKKLCTNTPEQVKSLAKRYFLAVKEEQDYIKYSAKLHTNT